ncbi:hypothetical protein GUITHDRAFT_145261 [Guillardia theta CCMP2712]|uniref:Tyrosine-protein kinase ephrin type A/B receptor-like domain-containing protein n=1 Tax=Guillardia theta (strain CCMP2712) TaxID=905079 RepID=L1ILM8_GUITC|nr:hypothetical protein GUITHDRAFT_145261 [Guillardia theta CCMP2712]EKX37161.1 hypothetical protein GUITHDRAFT_145261 [Guillardia theta CCMP2712]|eukprot:XP_005824141.1 hypothetical protein GUITHDRAFT_145261 [Guillardia theta CCMP2712]
MRGLAVLAYASLLQLAWLVLLAQGLSCPAGSEPLLSSELVQLVKECNLTSQSPCSLHFPALTLSDTSELNVSIYISPHNASGYFLAASFSMFAFTEKLSRDYLGSNCTEFDVYTWITKTSDIAPNSELSIRINGSSSNTSSCPSLLARVQVSYTPACRPCAQGSYAGVNSSSCEACPALSTSPGGSIALDNCTCQAGYTGKNISDCQGCPAGQFKGLMGFQACDDCPVGTYSQLEGSSACTNCPMGMTSVGGTSSCICAGGYVFEAAFRCFPCPAGSFKNATGNGTCSVCGDGTYASSNGTVVCLSCPKGSYREKPPQLHGDGRSELSGLLPTQLDGCNGELNDRLLQPGMTTCAPCDPGYFSHIASSECTADVVDVLVEVFVSGDVDAFTLDLQSNLTQVLSSLFLLPLDLVYFVSSALVGGTQSNNLVEQGNVTVSNASNATELSNSTNSSNTTDSFNSSDILSTPPSTTPLPSSSSSPVVKATWRVMAARSFFASLLQTFDRQQFLRDFNASHVLNIVFTERCGAGRQRNATGSCEACPVGTFKNASDDSQCFPCRSNASTAGEGVILSTDCLCLPGYKFVSFDSPCEPCSPGSYSNTLANQDCQLCAANTYNSKLASTSCTACPPRSVSGEGSPSISSCLCVPGYRPDSTASSFSCRMCPVNTYKNFTGNTECVSCPPHSVSSMRTVDIKYCRCDFGYTGPNTNCTPCPAGTYKEYPGPYRSLISRCIPGYGSNLSSTCSLCPIGTYKFFVATVECLTCPGNFSTHQIGSTSCECSPGFQLEGGNCTRCPQGTWKNYTGNETCSSCPPDSSTVPGAVEITDCICNAGYEWVDNGCSFCSFGKIRKDLSWSSCQPCPPGRSSNADRTVCTFTGCAQGEWWKNCSEYENAACMPCTSLQPCPNGFYWDSCQAWDDAQCRPCTNSKPLNAHFTRPGLPAAPTSCPSWACDQGYEEIGGDCVACPSGKYSNRGQPSCSSCPGDTDSLLPGQGFCRACKTGFYIESFGMDGHAICTPCPDNSTTSPNQNIYSFSTCHCSRGYMGFSWKCQPCQPGTYKPNVTGSTDLQLYYSGFQLLDLCVKCPPMTFNDLPGQSSASSCLPCLPGSTAPEGSASCSCPAGQYDTDPTGQASCLPCPSNTFNDHAGQLGVSSCLPCPNNSYSAEGQVACFCNYGYFSAGQCLGCPAGKYKQDVGCFDCPAFATSNEGSVSSSQCFCRGGYYGSPSSSCLICPLNTTSLPGAAATLSDCICEEGYYGSNTDCVQCPLLSKSPAGSTVLSSCTCVPGSAGDPGRNISCKLCSAVDPNSYSWESSFNCSCNAGYYGSFVFVEDRVQVNCSLCPQGTYSSTPAVTHCTSCPSNKTSQLGSTSLSACTCPTGTVEASGECVVTQRRLLASSDEVSCPPNSSQTMSGSCLCDPGHFSSSGAPPCSPCMEGTVTKFAGSSSCASCPAGSISIQDRTSCVCPVGQYGQAGSCVRCPSGMLAVAGSDEASDCECEEGFYLHEEEEACRRCPEGSSSRRGSVGLGGCACVRGYFGRPWEGRGCSACPANASSEENSTTAQECFCSAGFYAGVGEDLSCSRCPPRSFSLPGSRSISNCMCDEGFYGNLSAHQDCSPCPANSLAVGSRLLLSDCLCMEGYFSVPSGRCLACPANALSSLGSRSIFDCTCNAGYYGTPGVLSSPPTCKACPAGKYSWGPVRLTEDSCLSCPAHSMSNSSSLSREDCKCASGYCRGEGESWECTPCSCPAGLDGKMCLLREL